MQFSARQFFIMAIIGSLFTGLWLYGNGYIVWARDSYKCYNGRGFYKAVPKQRLIAVGALSINYQPLTWGCAPDARYDQTQYHMLNGQLVPTISTP